MSEVTHRCEPHRKAADIGFRLLGIIFLLIGFVTHNFSTGIDREEIGVEAARPCGLDVSFTEDIK